MFKRKSNAFTLIELIATLVIMAIIALIVTPLVMNIIRKARISADKRSIDAYGRSIELAIAGYLLDTGTFPTSIEQLTIEYSGNKVECETTRINSDSSVYLAGCTVNSRGVEGYTYGKEETVSYKAYSIGDEVTYNNVDYYVIKDSGENESTVTLLKAEPLSVSEVNQYGGVGTENNHVNKNASESVGEAYDINGYGGMLYYSSEKCTSYENKNGCRSDFKSSDIKYVLDNWARSEIPSGLINVKLLSFDDLINSLGYEYYEQGTSSGYRKTENTPSWLYNNNFDAYWTMSPNSDLSWSVWYISGEGGFYNGGVYCNYFVVRPVIVLDKSVL